MLKSLNKKMIVALGLFIGLSLKPIIANAQDIVWDKTVEKDKSWTIKFNKEIVFDESTKKEISIKDSNGITVNVNILLAQITNLFMLHLEYPILKEKLIN